jgi:MFS family permease
MLGLTVLATIVSYYEFGFSLLPLWLPSLHFSLQAFGYFVAFAVLLSAISAMYGGPLADRHGRVAVIDTCLLAMIILTFANLLMTGFWSFVIVRGSMNMVAGLMWGALGGITRDMSPRTGRGAAFGLLTLGAVGCQFLWNFIPGLTLPIFHTWQSQIWIMGILAVVIYIPVALWLKDLPADLRLRVMESEESAAAMQTEGAGEQSAQGAHIPESATAAFKVLLSRWAVWALVVGVVAFLSVALTIQNFGSEMFVEAFHYNAADATSAASKFWLLNGVLLVPAGYFSDWLAMRKPLSLIGTVVILLMLLWWIPTFDHPLAPGELGIVVLILGGLVASTYIPWTAEYSELLEDISPALQASGWSFFQFIFRVGIAASGILIPLVSARWGWTTWMWICFVGAIVFVLGLLSVRGHWKALRVAEASA